MNFFDDVLNRTKETISIVGKKTGEVMSAQKIKFDISATENRREKDFARLGKLCYESFKDTDVFSEEMSSLANEIEAKTSKIGELKLELAAVQSRKFCPNCKAVLDKDANFCRSCGEQVVFDSSEA